MQKILVVGDLHLSGRNPKNRRDDLVTSQWEKIKTVVKIANKHKAPVVSTGDIFEQPLVSNRIMSILGEILSDLNNPWFFVFGNHDLQYHTMEMIDQTSLGVMWLNNQKLLHISEFEGIYGIPWGYIDWKSEFHDPEATLLLAHRAIVNDDLISSSSWILEDKYFCQHVKELTKYELIICGHWHKSYEYFYQHSPTKDVHVLNPGVVCRRTIDEREDPSAFLLDLDSIFNNTDDYSEKIDLGALPADDVMRTEDMKSGIKSDSVEITKFVDELKSNKLSKSVFFVEKLTSCLDAMEDQPGIQKELRDIITTVQSKKKGTGDDDQ